MNENLNLVEILKNVPKGTKLWSPIFGDVELDKVDESNEHYPIIVTNEKDAACTFTKDGRLLEEYPGQCMLFPSEEQRDWSQFKANPVKPKVKVTLHPFDRVLARDYESTSRWHTDFFSHYNKGEDNFPCVCTSSAWTYVIPYDQWTAQLLGTTDECPVDYDITYSRACRL